MFRGGTGTEGYDLLEEIARGGMGVVYRARQRSLGRIVALKVLLGGAFAGVEGQRRLRAEAAAAARLDHPNIVAVHETGELDGQPFYSMEFVPGHTLAEAVREGPMPAGRAARYLVAIAEAVHHAHTQGILHRDLKPSNVLLDLEDRPRVTDFGLAKPIPGTEGRGTEFGHAPLNSAATLTGQVLGSPAYMAPEQAFPTAVPIGPGADVYSLGCILYELLVARPPFQGSTPQAVLAQLRDIEPVSPRRLDANVPVDLETLCLKCLEKDPSRRYASAGDLADDLRRFLRGEPVRARPAGIAGRTWRWARRRPVVAGLATALILAMGLGAVLSVLGARRLRESRDLAQERLAESLLAEARARRLAEEPGHRAKALERIEEARRLDGQGRLTLRLRREAIAALARTDVRRVAATRLPRCMDMMQMAFDPRFELCALGDGFAGGIDVYRVDDGALVCHLAIRPPDEVVGFDPEGRYLALRHGNGVSLWAVAEGRRLLAEEDGEGFGFNSGAFSPDGHWFGRAERGGSFAVYRLGEGGESGYGVVRDRTWRLPRGRLAGEVRWSADATRVAMIQAGDWVAVCDAASGELRWEMHRPDGLSGLAWLPRLQALAMGTGRDSVVLFSAEDGSALGPAGVPIHTTESLAASRLGDRLAVSTERFGTRVYEVEGGRLLGTDPCGAWHLHFSGDGNRVGTLMEDGRPAWVEILGSRVLRRVDTGPVPPDSVLAFTAGGEELMVLARDGVQFWRVADGRRLGGVLVRKAVGAVLAEQGRRLYLTRGSDLLGVDLGALGEGTVEAAALMPLLQGQRFWGVAAGARRGRIAVADLAGNRVRILNPAGTLEREFEPFVAPGYVAFSPDERWLACGGGTNAGVWDLEAATAAPVRLFRGEGERVRFSPSGRWLIGEGRDLRLWRTGTWEAEEVVPLASSNTQGFAAAVSPDDHWLAATQQDREIQLVDVSRRVVVAVLEGPGEGRVSRLEFSPDGTRLAATRDRGEVQVWDLVALREELARRNLAW